jgi:hypothetical protein
MNNLNNLNNPLTHWAPLIKEGTQIGFDKDP